MKAWVHSAALAPTIPINCSRNLSTFTIPWRVFLAMCCKSCFLLLTLSPLFGAHVLATFVETSVGSCLCSAAAGAASLGSLVSARPAALLSSSDDDIGSDRSLGISPVSAQLNSHQQIALKHQAETRTGSHKTAGGNDHWKPVSAGNSPCCAFCWWWCLSPYLRLPPSLQAHDVKAKTVWDLQQHM